MNVEFNGRIWYWKGPAPWFFVTLPTQTSEDIKAVSSNVTYGWGMIPVIARIGKTRWQTAMFPKDDSYILPLKAAVRKAENLSEGDETTVYLEIG